MVGIRAEPVHRQGAAVATHAGFPQGRRWGGSGLQRAAAGPKPGRPWGAGGLSVAGEKLGPDRHGAQKQRDTGQSSGFFHQCAKHVPSPLKRTKREHSSLYVLESRNLFDRRAEGFYGLFQGFPIFCRDLLKEESVTCVQFRFQLMCSLQCGPTAVSRRRPKTRFSGANSMSKLKFKRRRRMVSPRAFMTVGITSVAQRALRFSVST